MTRYVCTCALALSVFLTGVAGAFAQELVAARITGTVADETSAPMPGVTVTLTSPALQVPQVVQVTDSRGEYQFLDLRPGTYRVNYELQGFASVAREGIILTQGFAARVDVTLKGSNFVFQFGSCFGSPMVCQRVV